MVRQEPAKLPYPSSTLGATFTLQRSTKLLLYLIATPIGNLADITLRALDTLRLCDYILCEDTRHSQRLLAHHQIQKPLKSYHQFNEKRRSDEVIADLKSGLNIALITDAGTPSISDPGEILVKRCLENGLPITSIPGACAAVVALTISGLATDQFQMLGFLPKKKSVLKRIIGECLAYRGTSICYESPYRVVHTLRIIEALDPARSIVLVRELTKIHEQRLQGTAPELIAHFGKNVPRGEFVMLINGQAEVKAPKKRKYPKPGDIKTP